jgi:hypothetical protein
VRALARYDHVPPEDTGIGSSRVASGVLGRDGALRANTNLLFLDVVTGDVREKAQLRLDWGGWENAEGLQEHLLVLPVEIRCSCVALPASHTVGRRPISLTRRPSA